MNTATPGTGMPQSRISTGKFVRSRGAVAFASGRVTGILSVRLTPCMSQVPTAKVVAPSRCRVVRVNTIDL